MSWIWERVKRRTSAQYKENRKNFKILAKPFFEMEQLRREGKVEGLVNMDDYEVTQRVGHVAFTHRGKIMVWGGYMSVPPGNEGGMGSNKYWRSNWLMTYNSVARTWIPIYTHPKDCPPPMSSGTVCVHGDTLYVFCGFILEDHIEEEVPEDSLKDRLAKDGILNLLTFTVDHYSSADNVNTVYALDLLTRKWRIVDPAGTPPFPCDKLTSIEYKGKSYLFGGYGPEPQPQHRLSTPKCVTWIMDHLSREYNIRGWNNMLVEFDPGSGPDTGSATWKWVGDTSPLWPSPRAAHAMAVDKEGGYAILFGGRFGRERLNDLHLLDMSSFSWSLLLPATDDDMANTFNCPIGRSWHSLTSLSDNNFLLYGGYSTNEQPLSDCWLFSFNPLDHAKSKWTRLNHLEDPHYGIRYWHSAVKSEEESSVVVVGGYASQESVNSPSTRHGNALVRLEFSPASLFSLALDSSCQVMEHRKFTAQLPRIIIEAINKRMPKYCYDRARKAVWNAQFKKD